MEELLVEDLTSDIFHTVGHWIFEDFATEVIKKLICTLYSYDYATRCPDQRN